MMVRCSCFGWLYDTRWSEIYDRNSCLGYETMILANIALAAIVGS